MANIDSDPSVAINPRYLWAIPTPPHRVRHRVIRVVLHGKGRYTTTEQLRTMTNPHGAGLHFTAAEMDTTGCGVDSLAVVVGELVLDAVSAGGAAVYPTMRPHYTSLVQSQDELRGTLSMVVPDSNQPRWTLVRLVAGIDQRFYILEDRNPVSGLCNLRQAPSVAKRDKFMVVYDEWVNVPPVGLREHYMNSISQFCNRTAEEHMARNAVDTALSVDSSDVKNEDDMNEWLLANNPPGAQGCVDFVALSETVVDSDEEDGPASLPVEATNTTTDDAVAGQLAYVEDDDKPETLETMTIQMPDNPDARVTQALHFLLLLSFYWIVLCFESRRMATLSGER